MHEKHFREEAFILDFPYSVVSDDKELELMGWAKTYEDALKLCDYCTREYQQLNNQLSGKCLVYKTTYKIIPTGSEVLWNVRKDY